MSIAFHKYQGAGNDFIIIDIRNHAIPTSSDIVSHLCDRHMGIGADGLILLDNSAQYDFEMRYFNADGLEGSMCGNGGRCIAAFAQQQGIIEEDAHFLAIDGEHHARILSQQGSRYEVRLKMQDVVANVWEENEIFLQTGSPHLIQIVHDLGNKNVRRDGKVLRYDSRFGEEGSNINFVEEIKGQLHMRTYERGVENETLSCGTGATAAAIAWAIRNNLKGPVKLNARGGKLEVSFEKTDNKFTDIYLSGPAEFVFSGHIEI